VRLVPHRFVVVIQATEDISTAMATELAANRGQVEAAENFAERPPIS
jgi:hypothetical protein